MSDYYQPLQRDWIFAHDFGLAEHAFVNLIDLDEVADEEQGHGAMFVFSSCAIRILQSK
jgi:hypothetical protein